MKTFNSIESNYFYFSLIYLKKKKKVALNEPEKCKKIFTITSTEEKKIMKPNKKSF